MNAVPAEDRGAAAGMRGTFFNAGSSLSIGVFFSLMIVGLAAHPADDADRRAGGARRPAPVAQQIGHCPRSGSLFAAFLGYNPVAELLGPTGVLRRCRPAGRHADRQHFFPHLISGPFHDGLVVVFVAAAVMMLIAAVASFAHRPRADRRCRLTADDRDRHLSGGRSARRPRAGGHPDLRRSAAPTPRPARPWPWGGWCGCSVVPAPPR